MFDRGHELLDAAEAFQSAHGEYLWKDELKRVQGLFRTEEPALKVTLPRSGGAKSLPGLSPPADQFKA
jgi:hypothetical protein